MHELSMHVAELPDVDDWLSGDSRELAYQVVHANGDPIDISDASVSWALYRREYEDQPSDAVLSESDSGVEVITDSRVDSANGEFKVRVSASATEGLHGELYHRPEVEQQDGTTASWRGRVVIEA